MAVAFCALLAACSGSDSSSLDASTEVDSDSPRGCVPTGNTCPNYELSETDVVCQLDNSTSIDLVQDSRLEFGTGPDDAILFTAPAAGDYVMRLISQPSTNMGCHVTVDDIDDIPHDIQDCPAPGATVDLGGFFTGQPEYSVALAQGQQVVIFVGCTTWSSAQSGPYELEVYAL